MSLHGDDVDLENGFDLEQNPFDLSQPSAATIQTLVESEPNTPETSEPMPSSFWRCIGCDSGFSSWINGSWTCDDCGKTEFYDSRRPTRMQNQTGTWMYMPNNGESPGEQLTPSPTSSRSRRRRRRRQRLPDGQDPSSSGAGSERAESEQLTNDPTVEPSEPHGRVPAARPAAPAQVPRRAPDAMLRSQVPSATSHEDKLLTALRRLVQQMSRDDEGEWNLRKGPEKGVRWRTGQHPQPPQWRYDSQDLRAYAKFAKKVQIWQIQMRPYAAPPDQALLLWGSLTGDAEQELEHLTIEEVHRETGVQTILRKLQIPFEQRAVFQKRKFLHEFEALRRWNGETI